MVLMRSININKPPRSDGSGLMERVTGGGASPGGQSHAGTVSSVCDTRPRGALIMFRRIDPGSVQR